MNYEVKGKSKFTTIIVPEPRSIQQEKDLSQCKLIEELLNQTKVGKQCNSNCRIRKSCVQSESYKTSALIQVFPPQFQLACKYSSTHEDFVYMLLPNLYPCTPQTQLLSNTESICAYKLGFREGFKDLELSWSECEQHRSWITRDFGQRTYTQTWSDQE